MKDKSLGNGDFLLHSFSPLVFALFPQLVAGFSKNRGEEIGSIDAIYFV